MATKKVTKHKAPWAPNINLEVPAIPEGLLDNCTVYRAWGRTGRLVIFVKHGTTVYTLRSQGLNLCSSLNVNDDIRRTYARLAGIPFKDLAAAVKAQRIVDAQIEASDKIQSLKSQAAKAGYRLVKERT